VALIKETNPLPAVCGRVCVRPCEVACRRNLLGEGAAVTDRTIDVHITALRKKLGSAGVWIQTVRGVGYAFREPVAG